MDILSACFCVMRRKRRRLLDPSIRVADYNPLTASSYWTMAAVLTEFRHDSVFGLPGTQKRVLVDAPPHQTVHGIFHGDFDVVLTSQTEVLVCRCFFSSRWYRQGHLRRVCCPHLPLSGRCGAAVVKQWSRTLLFHCSLLASQSIWKE